MRPFISFTKCAGIPHDDELLFTSSEPGDNQACRHIRLNRNDRPEHLELRFGSQTWPLMSIAGGQAVYLNTTRLGIAPRKLFYADIISVGGSVWFVKNIEFPGPTSEVITTKIPLVECSAHRFADEQNLEGLFLFLRRTFAVCGIRVLQLLAAKPTAITKIGACSDGLWPVQLVETSWRENVALLYRSPEPRPEDCLPDQYIAATCFIPDGDHALHIDFSKLKEFSTTTPDLLAQWIASY